MTHPSVNSIVERLTRIADASRRDDGSDIPLGEQCREAATIISELQAERDRLNKELQQQYQEADAQMYQRQAAESSLSRIKAETIEECARVAENPGFIGAQDTDWDLGVNFAKTFIASAIRSLGSTGGAEKTAESGNPAPTRERE